MWTSLNFGKFLPAQARQNVFFTPFTHTPVPGHYSAALCHYVLDLSFLEFHLDDTVWYTLLLWPAASAQHAFEVYPCYSVDQHSHPFTWLNDIPLCGYTTTVLSFNVLMDICFQVWTILSNAAVRVHVNFSMDIRFHFSWMYPEE